mmetsp:Transcript_2468/g.7827  ORF Transcript_2468/g.7827 Transcript_2468/m.7827 type:complete len:501 (+) Transcript_2468:83-1585(+)
MQEEEWKEEIENIQSKKQKEGDLRYMYMGPEGAQDVAALLRKNTYLQRLLVSSNELGDEGIALIAKALKRNTTLVYMDLSYNDISEPGARSLLDALQTNVTLHNLVLLGNTNIPDALMRQLAQQLETNKTRTPPPTPRRSSSSSGKKTSRRSTTQRGDDKKSSSSGDSAAAASSSSSSSSSGRQVKTERDKKRHTSRSSKKSSSSKSVASDEEDDEHSSSNNSSRTTSAGESFTVSSRDAPSESACTGTRQSVRPIFVEHRAGSTSGAGLGDAPQLERRTVLSAGGGRGRRPRHCGGEAGGAGGSGRRLCGHRSALRQDHHCRDLSARAAEDRSPGERGRDRRRREVHHPGCAVQVRLRRLRGEAARTSTEQRHQRRQRQKQRQRQRQRGGRGVDVRRGSARPRAGHEGGRRRTALFGAVPLGGARHRSGQAHRPASLSHRLPGLPAVRQLSAAHLEQHAGLWQCGRRTGVPQRARCARRVGERRLRTSQPQESSGRRRQ